MMVFSVIGDSESLVPSPWPAATLKTAIIDAAKNAGGYHFVLLLYYYYHVII